jgi:hypothetical protein
MPDPTPPDQPKPNAHCGRVPLWVALLAFGLVCAVI